MSTDSRFTHVLPPVVETYLCNNDRPCRYEHPIDPVVAARGDCPHRSSGCANAPAALGCLTSAYGQEIQVVHVEPSTSIVIRSEHRFVPEATDRLSIRKHIYERISSTSHLAPGMPAVVHDATSSCHRIDGHDQFGAYLGFADLRRKSSKAPLALGVLAPPRRFRQDPEAFVITGEYGPIFGGAAFPSTVYSRHDPLYGGARCAQSCIIMALSMLADRGTRIEGSYALSCLGLARDIEDFRRQEPAECLGVRFRTDLEMAFAVGGLTASQMLGVFPRFGANAFAWSLPRDCWSRLAVRVVQAHLLARFPIIMSVHQPTWSGPTGQRLGEAHAAPRPDPNHSVLLIGFRHRQDDPDSVTFISHDPGTHPYCDRPAFKYFLAALATSPDNEGPLSMVAVTDGRIKVGLRTLLNACWAYSDAYRDRLRHWAGSGTIAHRALDHAAPGHVDDGLNKDDEPDMRMRLLERAALADFLLPFDATTAERNSLSDFLIRNVKLMPSRYWVVAEFRRRKVHRCWMLCSDAVPPRPVVVTELQFELDPLRPKMKSLPAAMEMTRSPGTRGAQQEQPVAPEAAGTAVGQATPARGRQKLVRSVISSSSTRRLAPLMREVSRVNGIKRVDLMMLREIDISDMSDAGFIAPGLDAMGVLEDEANNTNVIEWICAQFLQPEIPGDLKVSALATYLPDITRVTVSGSERERARRALVNAIRIGIGLTRRGLMEVPIVEAVCGTCFDACTCPRCQVAVPGVTVPIGNHIFKMNRDKKVELLVESLGGVINDVTASSNADFAIALELEPGDDYVLNNEREIGRVRSAIQQAGIERYVGLNVDLAHYQMANVRAEALRGFAEMIVHAHIADHPMMHTRDQPIGAWTPVECGLGDGFYPLLQVLSECGMAPGRQVPFSGTVALELEGCNRMSWVHRSLGAMNHLLAATTP